MGTHPIFESDFDCLTAHQDRDETTFAPRPRASHYSDQVQSRWRSLVLLLEGQDHLRPVCRQWRAFRHLRWAPGFRLDLRRQLGLDQVGHWWRRFLRSSVGYRDWYADGLD